MNDITDATMERLLEVSHSARRVRDGDPETGPSDVRAIIVDYEALVGPRVGGGIAELVRRIENVPDTGFSKIEYRNLPPGHDRVTLCGAPVEVHWKGEERIVDTGYLMALPGYDDDYEFVVHVPIPSGIEKDAPEPEWVPLAEIAANPQVAKVVVGPPSAAR